MPLVFVIKDTTPGAKVPLEKCAVPEVRVEVQQPDTTDHSYGTVPYQRIEKNIKLPGSLQPKSCSILTAPAPRGDLPHSLLAKRTEKETVLYSGTIHPGPAVETELGRILIDENAASRKEFFNNMEKKKKFSCPFCSKRFHSRQGKWRHKRLMHPGCVDIEMSKRGTISCPECSEYRAITQRDLVEHLVKEHGKDLQISYKQFPSEGEFQLWKKKVEKETCSRFSVAAGATKMKRCSIMRYYCHRSGGQKLPKPSFSCKIGSICSAYLRVKRELTGSAVKVEYCLTHTGHTQDPKYQKLSKETTKSIAHRLAQGEEPLDILDDVRSKASELDKAAFLTLRQINNIRKQFKISNAPAIRDFYECRFCKLQFRSRRSLTMHRSKKHPESISVVRSSKVIGPDKDHVPVPAEPILQDQTEGRSEQDVDFTVAGGDNIEAISHDQTEERSGQDVDFTIADGDDIEENLGNNSTEVSSNSSELLSSSKNSEDLNDVEQMKIIAFQHLSDVLASLATTNSPAVVENISKALKEVKDVIN
ncbi:zinc finger protein [Elysia marginata]|uniref:Zinc finger protein n=1 Tax=Elysia marginata TaxID=1093978 RepID=A0AAV4GQI5_9GAST|nr:zinc finger protein [Elysia marginata]